MRKVIGSLKIGLLKGLLGLLEEPARSLQRPTLGRRQPLSTENKDSLLDALLQLNYLSLQF